MTRIKCVAWQQWTGYQLCTLLTLNFDHHDVDADVKAIHANKYILTYLALAFIYLYIYIYIYLWEALAQEVERVGL